MSNIRSRSGRNVKAEWRHGGISMNKFIQWSVISYQWSEDGGCGDSSQSIIRAVLCRGKAWLYGNKKNCFE